VRIIVCGGRAYADADFVARTLSRVLAKHPDLTIIDGGAPGPTDWPVSGPWPMACRSILARWTTRWTARGLELDRGETLA
jgi:hypothetical protein